MKIYTIGFTKKRVERFFGLLRESRAERLVDVRLRNTSELSGFAKKDDLAWFLRGLCEIDYIHLPQLSTTWEMLDAYRKYHKSWDIYKGESLSLMKERRIVQRASSALLTTPSCCAASMSRSIVIVGWLLSTCNGIGTLWKLSICSRPSDLPLIGTLQPAQENIKPWRETAVPSLRNEETNF